MESKTNGEIDLRSLVSTVLLGADNIGHALIEVEELDGTVTLKGRVGSEEDRLFAEALVREQQGVVQVINLLKVVGIPRSSII